MTELSFFRKNARNRKKVTYTVCFAYIEKALNRIPRKVTELTMRKKGLSEITIKTMITLYEGMMTYVKVQPVIYRTLSAILCLLRICFVFTSFRGCS